MDQQQDRGQSFADFHASLTDLAARVNGLVYQGDRLEAVVKTVAVLRDDPELARRLGIGR